MIWSLEITRGENGYKCKYDDEVDDGTDDGTIVCREEYIQDDEMDELKSGEELLWWVVEYFNLGGTKHDPERIRIVREKKGE